MSEPADKPIPTCAAPGCSNEVKRTGSRGPHPIYCGEPCKQVAFRARRNARGYLPAIDRDQLHVPAPAPTDTQVAQAVAEASVLSAVFARLANEARPEFAYRCELMYLAIRAALDEHFDGADR